jgi:hypothetical protein
MGDKYNKQDGEPQPPSADRDNVVKPGSAPTAVGDRSTQEEMGGQGLGQFSDEEAERRGNVDSNLEGGRDEND